MAHQIIDVGAGLGSKPKLSVSLSRKNCIENETMSAAFTSLCRIDKREQRLLSALSILSILIGLIYVVVIHPGTPYDEPSHFSIVQYYARFAGMPVLGKPGVSYEGYQAPLYYFLNAFLYYVIKFAGQEVAFYTLRVFGLALLIPAILISYRIARCVFPNEDTISITTAMFIALNPSLLAIASSIQNDMLTIVLSMWITYLTIKWASEDLLDSKRVFILALLVSLAVLTKMTAAFLIIAVPLFLWILHRHRAVKRIGVFLATVMLSTGWWFLRNIIIYGDLTGAKAMKLHFPEGTGSPLSLWRPDDLLHWLRSIVTYLWLPVEYYRNLIRAPFLLEVFVGAFMAACVIGWLLWLRQDRPLENSASIEKSKAIAQFLSLQYIVCMGIYAFNTSTQWHLPGRITLPTLTISAMLICGGAIIVLRKLDKMGDKFFAGLLCAFLLISNAFILWSAHRLSVFPFHLFT